MTDAGREPAFSTCIRHLSIHLYGPDRHPYAETFVIHRGRALFTVGEAQVVGAGGQILVVPALVAHRFEVLDGGTYEATHIHANDRFVTEWLE